MCRQSLTLLVLLACAPVHAQVVEGSVSTILSGRANPRDGNVYTVLPVYEGLRLTLREVQLPHVAELRLEVSGWLGGLFDSESADSASGAMSDVSILEGKIARRHILVRMSRRERLTGGAARFTHLDGASITLQAYRAGLTVFGGVPSSSALA